MLYPAGGARAGRQFHVFKLTRLLLLREITGGLVIAGSDGTEPLELAEKIVDQLSCLVPVPVMKTLVLAMALRRYDRGLTDPA